MFIQTGGGGKGIRPNQQQQHQQQQQQQQHQQQQQQHHQSHHQTHNQTHHSHSSQQSQSQTSHHSHQQQPSQHSHHPHQLQQQQQHHHIHQPSHQAPYYSFQLSQQTASHIPQHHQQQAQNNAVKTPSPPTQNTGGTSGATPSSSISMVSANNGNSSSNTNLSRQHAASGNNLQHYATHTASAAGTIMQPSSTAAFMTTTYLQQQYHQQSAAVMAAAAAAAQYNTVAGAAGHTPQTQNTNAAAQSLYQSQQQQHQQQQHHQTLHQTHHQPTLHAHYYHPSAGAPTPTPTHMHPHHAHAQQHQLRGILTAPAHQRQPVYLTPANAIFALPSGPLQQQQQRSSLLTAHQQSGATGTPVSVTLQSAAAAARNATGGPTAYITPPFCQPPLPMGATTLTQPPPMLTTAASIATPALQAYGHMAAAAAAAAAANASTSSTSINTTENVKTRKYAIPIIHPITHENVMNPKPQKKSASVEAKPSAMECEQSKSPTTTTTTVTGTADKYNESASMNTAEQKLMPTISASKDKIDQQMQTDAIKDKSSNTKINFQANATKTESPSATISTTSNLDEEEYDNDMLLFRKQLPADELDMLPVADFNPNEDEEFLDEDEEHITVFVEEVNASTENAINFDDDYVEPTSGNINDDDIDRDVDAEDMQLEDVETQMMQGQEQNEQELGQHRPKLLTHESINIEYDTVSTNKLQVYVLEEQPEQGSELMMPKKLEPYFHHQQNQLKQPLAQIIQKTKSNNNKQNTTNIAPTIAVATATNAQIKPTKTITATSTSTTSSAALATTATILKATPKLSPATSGTSSSTTSTPTHINMNTTMTTTMQQPQQQLQQQQKLKTTVLPQVANTKNVVATAAAAAVNYNANTTRKNRKGKKGAAAKEIQKKLKQQTTTATIETSNRSNSSSSSNYNNNSNTLNNNNNNNNNKSSLNNTSLANNNIILLTDINSIRLSNSNISEAGATTTTVATDTGVTVTTPLGYSTKQQQQQYKKCNESTNNNLGRGTSTTSIRSLTAEQEYICDNPADDSTPSSTRAASPALQRKHIKTQEIVAQFLQPHPSTKAKTPEELQLQFLNSSASACEDEEDLNARLQLQQQQEEAVAKDLRFGDFNDDRDPSHPAPITVAPPYKFSKGTTSNMGGSKSNDTVDCMIITAPSKSAAALKSIKLSCTTPKTRLTQQPPPQPPLPKNLKYTLEELRALAKCSEARKPPLVSCQKGACIAQLFVPRQQHHHMTQHHHGLNMSPLALQQHLHQQYQHMSFNESIEYVAGKRRGGGGQAKKHHDHQSVVTQAGASGAATATQQQRKPMDVIRVQLSLNEEIKLSECENAWQPETLRSHSSSRHSPAGSNDDIEAVLKKVRGILNKLTPDNFDVLLKTMSSILMNTHEKMQQVMLLIFEKTISEPNFAPTYAKFCKVLFQEFKIDNKPQFSGSLIKRIQEEFESNVNDADAKKLKLQPLVDRLEACDDIKERIELQAELEDQEYQFRRRAWGTVRFIGEMYKLQSLTSDRVLICIESLLKHGCEEKLEYMCKLLTTVGHLLESKTAADQTNSNMRMDKIFRKIQEFVNKSAVRTGPGGSKPVQLKISSRVRFMMQDVMDLRARSWDQVAQPAAQRRSSIYAKSEDKLSQGSGGGGGAVGSGGGLMSGIYEKHSTAASSGRLAYGGGGGGGNQSNSRQSRQTVSSSSNPNDSNYFLQKPMKFSTQQQQEQQQKQFIDLNKLKFSRGDETTQSNTKLGNSSIYLWRTTGRQAASANMASTNSSNAALPLNDTFNPATNKRQANQFQALDKLDKLEQDAQQLPETMSICNSAIDDSYAVAFTTKDIQKLINRLIEEVLDTHSNNWHAEALNAWQSLNSKQKVALLHDLLTDYLHLASVKRPQRQACAKLFGYLMNDTQFDKQQVFAQAYAQFGEEFPDLLVDVPNGWTYVFEFLGPLLHARLLNFTDIWLPDWAADAAFTERFLKAFISYFTQEFGANYTYELWHKVYKLEQGQKFFIAGGNSVDRCRNFLTENKFLHIMERGTKGSQEDKQLQSRKQGHSLAEQVQRIEYLLDTASDCDLAIDYINTNVHINTMFIRNLTRFFCCDYATVMSATVATAAPPALSAAFASSLLNTELFRSKCIPLLRFCIDANELFEISCLDEIVDSLLRCYDSDSQLANELICSIFDMLYDCEIISKESFEKWYKASSSDGGDMMGGGSGIGVAAAVSEAASHSRQHYQHRQHRLTNKIHAYMAKIL